MAFVGVLGVLAILLAVIFGVAFWAIFSFAAVGIPVEIFIHDKKFNLVPWRAVLLIGVTVGLFVIRWYLPFAIFGAAGIVAICIEVFGYGR